MAGSRDHRISVKYGKGRRERERECVCGRGRDT